MLIRPKTNPHQIFEKVCNSNARCQSQKGPMQAALVASTICRYLLSYHDTL